MKRIFALILIFTFILSLSSCVANPTEIPTDSTELEEIITDEIEEISEEEPLKIGVFWYDLTNTFYSAVRDALNIKLDTLGVEYLNFDAARNQETQNDQINTAIANGADLLIVSIVDANEQDVIQEIVDKAKAAELPIIFFNRGTYYSDIMDSYENACHVVERAGDIGAMQGSLAGQYIVGNYYTVDRNGDGKISYIQMKCTLGHPESEARAKYGVEYCNAELTKAGKPELVFYDPNNTDKFMPTGESIEEAFRFMETALSTNPIDGNDPVELVLCNHDHLASGVIEALNNIGFNTGGSDFIPVFGIDGSYPELIESGKLTGTVQMSPINNAEVLAVLVENVINGNHIMENIDKQYNVYEEDPIIWVPYEIKAWGVN